ncbi:MAG: hypothetical protein CMJ44_15145 [Pimelobacter sp.]|nr:hypothetical protein [Pimelobacter sp.]
MGTAQFDHGERRSMTEPDRVRRGFWATLLRWRAPIVLIPLILGLGYSGTVGAQMLWAEVQPDPPPAPIVTCWNDAVEVADECPTPTGVPGLRWAFPSFKPGSAACKPVVYPDNGNPRPLEYTCRQRISGTRATVNYSERSDLERGLNYFANRYDGIRPARTGAGTRVVYRDPSPRKDGTYELTVAYTAYPFAVSVRAVNERLRDAVLSDVVTFRPERFMLVQPPERPRQDG